MQAPNRLSWIAVYALVACADEPLREHDCYQLSLEVTQERGSCELGRSSRSEYGIPEVLGAACPDSMDRLSCPGDWLSRCDQRQIITYDGPTWEPFCTYFGESVFVPESDTFDFDFVQTFQGRRGLIAVIYDDSLEQTPTGKCEFRPCD